MGDLSVVSCQPLATETGEDENTKRFGCHEFVARLFGGCSRLA
jgi:hypothetical protein